MQSKKIDFDPSNFPEDFFRIPCPGGKLPENFMDLLEAEASKRFGNPDREKVQFHSSNKPPQQSHIVSGSGNRARAAAEKVQQACFTENTKQHVGGRAGEKPAEKQALAKASDAKHD